jgi:hypothetical protein
MKTYRLLPLLPFLFAANASGDTFELKDGSKIEGTILRTEGSDYIIEVQVTKSIKDERRIPKADVARQFAEQKDETDFAAIAALVPAPDLYSEDEYEAAAAKVAAFLKKHPNSARKKEAQKIYDTLETELAVVKTGGVKFEGRMIPASERAPKAYGLDANIVASNMKKAGDKGEVLSALREWTKLEKDYLGSSAYRDNKDYAVTLMKTHLANVTSVLSGYDARVKARQSGLVGMEQSDRVRSEQAIQEEAAAYTARVEREKADGIKWLTLDPFAKPQLDETKRSLETEIRRLSTLDTSSVQNTEAAYEEAYAAVTKPGAKKQEIDSAISKARGFSMPQKYIDELTKLAPETPAP